MVKMWTCPFCGGKTKPISLDSLDKELLQKVLKEIKEKDNPVMVKCEKCGRIWVDKL